MNISCMDKIFCLFTTVLPYLKGKEGIAQWQFETRLQKDFDSQLHWSIVCLSVRP